MFKRKFSTLLLAALLLLTGCAPKDDFEDNEFDNSDNYELDDFADYEVKELLPSENVNAKTEFSEYDGNTEMIKVTIANDTDHRLDMWDGFRLEKEVDGEWKAIKVYYDEVVDSTLMYRQMPERCTYTLEYELKDNVKLPLLPGQYRIWVCGVSGTDNEAVSAEFTIK